MTFTVDKANNSPFVKALKDAGIQTISNAADVLLVEKTSIYHWINYFDGKDNLRSREPNRASKARIEQVTGKKIEELFRK